VIRGRRGFNLEEEAMPYIKREAREGFDRHIRGLAVRIISEGELNYAITRLVHEWLGSEPGYADYNAAVGVLECAKLELYRERVAKYEDIKKVKHGPLPDRTRDG
jgi:hypothetical protein